MAHKIYIQWYMYNKCIGAMPPVKYTVQFASVFSTWNLKAMC